MIKLHKDFKEFFEFINSEKVEYLVVGGYAVGFHGYPRYTGDIDVWVKATETNATKLLNALHKFGFGSLGMTVFDFIQPDQVFQLGLEPNRIDIMTSLSGLSFDQCFERKISTDISGVKVNFIDLNSLKENKKNTGRHKDLDDLENLPG